MICANMLLVEKLPLCPRIPSYSCCSIWYQQLRTTLKRVDGFHIDIFLRCETTSQTHEHLYTCYTMHRRIWAALHSWTLLCPFLGMVSSHIWLAPQGRVFLMLGLWNSILPKRNVWRLVEGTVVALDFSLLASLSCGLAAKYSFLFLKNRFTSTLEKPER